MAANPNEIRKIESLLSDYLEPTTKILNYETKMLTAPGENYGSVILAVDVTIQELDQEPKVLHLVAKRLPANEVLSELFNVQYTFKKEISMYLEVIPSLSKFQKEYGKEPNISDLFAKCYGGRINLNPDSDFVDDDAVLFLENLKIPGYDTGDRLVGFDKDHTYRILEDLARFHAVPIAFKLKKPDEFKKQIKTVATKVKIGEGFPEEMKQNAVKDITEILRKTKECIPYINDISECIMSSFSGMARMIESKEPFATIVHTDYWVNNTMILQDQNGKPIKNKIVDLQMPIYNAGAMDLLFFLYSSVIPEILYDNVDMFIKFYYNCFIECLQEFDVDISEFNWENFNKEIHRIAIIELGHILIMYTPILTKRGVIDDMSNMKMDSAMKPTDLSPDYESRLVNCVLDFIKHKWI